MFILSKEDFYTIALRKHSMNRKLEKLMAAEQLDLDAIREELEKNPKNGTNPYIIWDRFMYECTKVGCTTSDTDINLPTLFLKNGQELEYDLVANMHWTYTGDKHFESRFSFWNTLTDAAVQALRQHGILADLAQPGTVMPVLDRTGAA